MSQILEAQIQNEFAFRQTLRELLLLNYFDTFESDSQLLSLACSHLCYLLKSHSHVLYLQQIQSNFIVVIHPGSTTLRIGRATDTLPASIPHVIARRHKHQGQPLYKDNWLLREGLNVSPSGGLGGHAWQAVVKTLLLLPRGQVQSLVGELRSHKSRCVDKTEHHTHTRNVGPGENRQGCLLGRA